jgi:muramoyltetrapeptide carboxypeptidase LdcA involved in peptidoglycan recycling
MMNNAAPKHLIKPAALQKGDKIAAVTLSSGVAGMFPYRYHIGKKQFENAYDVHIVEMKHTLKDAEWIKNNPGARADDLMTAFTDPNIKGIISTIGGDDSIRILPYIDYDLIAQNPKVFVGYSDTTITHFICRKAGLSSFYGPALMPNFGENGGIFDYTKHHFEKTVFSKNPIGEIAPASEWTAEYLDWANPDNQKVKRTMREPFGRKILQGQGIVTGHLVGGCIQVLNKMGGTELWPAIEEWKGAIAFFELSESSMPLQDFRNWARELGQQGILKNLNGVIMARAGGQRTDEERLHFDQVFHDTISEFQLEALPILTQMDFGHTDPVFTIPFGAEAEINCSKKTFSILEPGVA